MKVVSTSKPKTWRQKRKRKDARRKPRRHIEKFSSPNMWKKDGQKREYVLHDDKTSKYFHSTKSKTVRLTEDISFAAKFSNKTDTSILSSYYALDQFLIKFGHTGAWRPIRIL